MMDSLLGASSVAQAALPSLVLLQRSDLVMAAERSLIFPLEEFSSSVDEDDWYTFAKSMSVYQGSVYGLPFASNVLGLLHRPGALSGDQPSWDELIRRRDSLLFPAGDADAQVALALYFSAGGALDVHMGKMEINPEALAAALNVIERAGKAGVIGRAALENQTDDQAWESFQAGNADGVITWVARLFTADEELELALLPPVGGTPFTFATGWLWCLAEQDEDIREYAAALAEHLSAPEFLAQWGPMSGYLPVRPSSLTAFAEERLQSTLSTMLISAHLRPDRPMIVDVSPQIKIAVEEVINGTQTAEESAQDAITRLKETENQ
jgi:ABC-type glycerol-3-phosphate transport system substrate-binding protein